MNTNSILNDAMRVFAKEPMPYDASGETKEARRERFRNQQRQWADKFWAAFERGVGSRIWESPDPSGCGEDGKRFNEDFKEFSVIVGQKVDLFGGLSFWAGKVGEYRSIWAQRLANELFDLGVRNEESLLRYSYAYLNSIKVIREIINADRDSAKSAQWRKVATRVVHEFSAVVEAMGDAESRKKWMAYVRHYLVTVCGSEEDLAKVFLDARKARAGGDVSTESTIAYAWILHDCMRQAIDKFKKRELVELFLSEIKALSLKDLPSKRPSDIGTLLQRDVKRAMSFLDGTLGVWAQFSQGNFVQAISLMAQKVREQPDNLELKVNLIDLCVSCGDFVTAFDCVNYFLTPGNVEIDNAVKGGRYAGTENGGAARPEKPVLAITRYVMKFPRTDSVCFYSTENGKKVPNWKIFKEGLARAYVDFVKEYINGHLDKNDRRGFVNSRGQQHKSLNERVCECLFRCVVNGVDENKRPLIANNTWVKDFVKRELSLSKGWKCDGEKMMARLELLSGQMDVAREGFEGCIARMPRDAESWYWLGRTFPEGERNFARCMCKAISLNPKGFIAGEAYKGLARYHAANGRKSEQLRELKKSMRLKQDAGVKTNNAEGEILAMELFDEVQAAPADKEEFAKLIEESNMLINVSQEEYRAVVVAVKKSNDQVRVCIEADSGRIFSNAPSVGLMDIRVGMPVIAVLTKANDNEPLKLLPRESERDWDVFPTSIGIAIAVDRNYGFAKIALDDALVADVGERLFGDACNVKIGDLFSVRYEVLGGKVRVYSCENAPESTAMPPFVRKTRGCLKRDNRHCEFAYADDVFVPGELCKNMPDGSSVTLWAVKVPVRRNQRAAWQAVKINDNGI